MQTEKHVTIVCGQHGPNISHGEVVCTQCGALWRLPFQGLPEHDDRIIEPANGPTCDCGAKLVGHDGAAMLVCRGCFDKHYPKVATDRIRAPGPDEPKLGYHA